ncbi:MAG: hypothetical protein UMV23_07140 [Halanaerobium sp.]|nr:hypothetical protein [Halanaerobium sp.]
MRKACRGKGIGIFFFLTLVISTFHLGNCQALAAANSKQLIILLDDVSLEEMKQFDRLAEFIEQGAYGLLNVRPDGPLQTMSSFFSLGSGSRAPQVVWEEAFLSNGREYSWGQAGVVLQGARNVRLQLEQGSYLPELSKLTTLLHERGRKVGLLSTGRSNPGALWLAADKEGRIDFYSQVEAIARDDFLYRANQLWDRCDLLLVWLGNIEEASISSIEKGPDLEDVVLGLLNLPEVKRNQVWFILPEPPSSAKTGGSRLSWIFWYDGQHGRASGMEATGSPIESGVLFSPTTRRLGLITIADIAPTILAQFGIEPPSRMLGRILQFSGERWGLTRLISLNRGIQNTANARPFFVKGFILLQIVLLVLVILFLLIKNIWHFVNSLREVLVWLIILIQFLPLVLLVFPSYLFADNALAFLVIVLSLAVLGYGSIILIRKIQATAVRPRKAGEYLLPGVLSLTILVIIIDLITGQHLLRSSLLGYCPIIGARYYGMGNEFMGIFLGQGIILAGLLMDYDINRGRNILLLLPVLVVFSGLPILGANFGGMLTAFLTSLVFLVLVSPGVLENKARVLWGGVLGGGIVVAGLIVFDLKSALPSHFGLTIHKFIAIGPAYLWEVIRRKVAMNIKLLRWTIWTRVLLAFMLTLLILLKKPIGVLKRLQAERPFFMSALKSVLLGSLITMLVNDSGVVAAATMLFPGIFILVNLVLQYSKKRQKAPTQ